MTFSRRCEAHGDKFNRLSLQKKLVETRYFREKISFDRFQILRTKILSALASLIPLIDNKFFLGA